MQKSTLPSFLKFKMKPPVSSSKNVVSEKTVPNTSIFPKRIPS
jgi:hypothetical protein